MGHHHSAGMSVSVPAATDISHGLAAHSAEHIGVWKLPSAPAAATLYRLPCASPSKPNRALVPLVLQCITVVFSGL
ncbi:hypothetical protein B296_00036980 [Ensete ventricosum]|uniref:Uncharacterized protein n=1 Tax=Ensete ventricosum TaxID=4639 RepID=A0A426XSU0_ENSVE|nr:hypothetical protein B296_00036980 [Ensete ventricosum]